MQITMIVRNISIKKRIFTSIALILILGFSSSPLHAQKSKKVERSADIHFHMSEFNQALPLYLSLLKGDPNSFLYNYRAAMCYMNSNVETDKCVGYFEKAKSNLKLATDSTPDFFYYMGHAYQIVNKFVPAIDYLNLSKSMLDKSADSLNIFFINSEIEQCKRGKDFMNSPTKAKLFNLGKKVNSKYPDYSPVIQNNAKTLFFTSTRKGSTAEKFHKQDEYYEDIYISQNNWNDSMDIANIESGFYQPNFFRIDFDTAFNAGKNVNTQYHDATISVDPASDTLYLFRLNDVWKSGIENGKLSKPEKFDYVVGGKPIRKSSLNTTADKKTRYFVSDQKGGIGGKDIYRSFKQADGTWGPEENLGPVINSSFDEEAPFFDSNEGLLYFSSQGHNTMGGFDVFRTKFDNDVWSTPENLGYPINSGTDDVFYSINSETNKGYISTMREGGIGNYDIYLVRHLKPLKVLFSTTYSEGLIPMNSNITIVSVKTGDSVQVAFNKQGDINYKSVEKFVMKVPHYDNALKYDTFEFETPESYGDFSNYQEINIQAMKNNKNQLVGYKTTLYNAFFDINKVAKDKNKGESNSNAYSKLVKTLHAENKYFEVYSKKHEIDTSIYAIYTEVMNARALASGSTDPIKIPLTPQEARALLDALKDAKDVAKEGAPSQAIVAKDVKPNKPLVVPSVMDPIMFAFSRYTLNREGKKRVDRLYDYLQENKDVSIKIVGYTDSKGSRKLNHQLGVKRAIEIKLILQRKGIAAKRMKAIGKGAENPKGSNDNEEGRKLNRRVEFEIM